MRRRGLRIASRTLGAALTLTLAGCFVDEAPVTSTDATDATDATTTIATTTATGATMGSKTTTATSTSTSTSTTDATTTDATTTESSTTGPDPELLIVSVEDGDNDALQDPDLSVKVAFGWITLNSPDHYGALRFAIPQLPQGAKIVAAEFRVYVDGPDTDSPRLEIYGELAPNPPIFSATPENVSARAKTLASVLWSADDVGDGWVSSPSIVSVIQELVDQEAWMPNQHMVLILDATSQASNVAPFEFRQVDNGADYAPQLGIQWLAP
ncbi:MAG: hypothetical protein R3A79_29240 [Nannocystaceae bacterium]